MPDDGWVLPEGTNFYASFSGASLAEVRGVLEAQGWHCRKCSWTDFELRNDWSELTLAAAQPGPLLHGAVVYEPAAVAALEHLLNSLFGGWCYEFYDREGHLLLERSSREWDR